MSNVFDMTKKELQAFLVAQGMKKFRADQIFHYIYKQNSTLQLLRCLGS